MPFIPLAQRKSSPLVLDEDKAALQQKQQAKDKATVDAHFGVAAGASGYRFANHPQTFGHCRGPDVPFRNATAPWRPPESDPDGPARQRDREQASYGAYWDSSHAMKGSRSSPALKTTGENVMEACHPLSAEIRRWKDMAHRTECETRKDIELKPLLVEHHPVPPKLQGVRQGLVLFPKYMLMNNCHLKSTDLQRFQRQQTEALQRSMERSASRSPSDRSIDAPSDVDNHEAMGESTRGALAFEASWGAPVLRDGGPQWAGNGMPSGGSCKTSNPFRMG